MTMTMTMTMTDTLDERQRIIDTGRLFLSKVDPLPSAGELAKPIVDALHGLHTQFAMRVNAMELDYSFGADADFDCTEPAEQLVRTVEDVIAILRHTISACMVEHNRGDAVPSMIDPIIRAITNPSVIVDMHTGYRFRDII